MATSIGQTPLRKKGQTTCIEHRGKHLDLYCEKCDTLICLKCLSTSHKGHDMCELSDLTPSKKQDIKNFIAKTEQNDLVQLQKYITSTDTLLKDNASNFDNISHKLKHQTEKLKQDLDLLTAQTLSLYHKMEEDNAKLIQTYKQDLEMYDKELRKQIKECKAAIQNGSHIEIYDTQCEIHSQISLPLEPVLGAASFIPNKTPQHHLELAFGEIATSDQGEDSTGQNRSVRTSGGQQPSSTSQQSDSKGNNAVTMYKLLQQTKVLDEWMSPVGIASICPTTDSQVISLPAKPVLVTANFIPNKNPQHHLELALESTPYSDSVGQDGSVRTSGDQKPSSATQQSELKRKKVELLPQTKVLEEWKSPVDINSVCPTTDDQVWTCCHSNTLTLLDRKGKVMQSVKHETNINDISLSAKTHILWVCDKENNILEQVSGKLKQRFRTKLNAKCICVTVSNHVIVGMTNIISKFTTQGEMVLTTSATGAGKPLVCSPRRISECPVTHNVAVVDLNSKSDGGDGIPYILVIDTDFKELFVYRGDIRSTYTQSPHKGAGPFDPLDVVYDSVGNIVIGDFDNRRVLLVSGGGEFLKVIHKDTDCTWSVGVDTDDVLWAGFVGNVKLLQYSSV